MTYPIQVRVSDPHAVFDWCGEHFGPEEIIRLSAAELDQGSVVVAVFACQTAAAVFRLAWG